MATIAELANPQGNQGLQGLRDFRVGESNVASENTGLLLILLLGLFLFSKTKEETKTAITYQNEETWEWIDWKGRQRQITVHRKVYPLS